LEASLPANLQEQRVTIGEVPSNTEVQTFGQLSRQLNLDVLVLVDFLADDSAIVGGKLHGAGSYLVGPGVTLQDLIAAAGGLDNWTDTSHVEIISTSILPAVGKSETQHQLVSLNDPAVANYVVKPHDEVRFSQIYASVGAGAVTIQGQVRDAGTFNIERGERLSELLLRAGGLTDEAYPFGTIFLR
jgi:protein involved in polysaccharide export with SLBB domain